MRTISRTAVSQRVLALAIGIAVIAIPLTADAQIPGFGPDTKACRLVPTAELESYYGAKASSPRGMDGEALSTCTVNFAAKVVKLQVSPPGTVGLPTSIEMGLNGAKMLASGAKSVLQLVETKDFGKVGCFTTKAATSLGNQPATNLFSTVCFVVDGGYMTLTLTDADPKRVSFDVVKPLVEKAAARRK